METQEQIDKWLDEMIEETERDIDIVFAKRLKDILSHIAGMYQKYSDGGSISRTEIYKYNRYQKELKFIEDSINEHYKELYRKINKLLQEQYVEQLLRSGFLYEFEAQREIGYVIPSLTVINQAILNPIKELTLTGTLTAHRNKILREVRIEIGQAIQNGESYGEMARRIEHLFVGGRQNPRHKAKMTARTEAGRVQTLARMKSAEIAEESGVDMKKMWNSTLDQDVRSSHRVLDGQVADDEGYFHYRGHKAKGPHLWFVAALDIACRCALVYLVEGVLPKLRRGRNYEDIDYQRKLAKRTDKYMEDGLTEKQAEKKAKREVKPPSLVIPYQPYSEWRKTLGKGA